MPKLLDLLSVRSMKWSTVLVSFPGSLPKSNELKWSLRAGGRSVLNCSRVWLDELPLPPAQRPRPTLFSEGLRRRFLEPLLDGSADPRDLDILDARDDELCQRGRVSVSLNLCSLSPDAPRDDDPDLLRFRLWRSQLRGMYAGAAGYRICARSAGSWLGPK